MKILYFLIIVLIILNFQYNNDIEVFCGHGENTTIGFEKTHNPFL